MISPNVVALITPVATSDRVHDRQHLRPKRRRRNRQQTERHQHSAEDAEGIRVERQQRHHHAQRQQPRQHQKLHRRNAEHLERVDFLVRFHVAERRRKRRTRASRQHHRRHHRAHFAHHREADQIRDVDVATVLPQHDRACVGQRHAHQQTHEAHNRQRHRPALLHFVDTVVPAKLPRTLRQPDHAQHALAHKLRDRAPLDDRIQRRLAHRRQKTLRPVKRHARLVRRRQLRQQQPDFLRQPVAVEIRARHAAPLLRLKQKQQERTVPLLHLGREHAHARRILRAAHAFPRGPRRRDFPSPRQPHLQAIPVGRGRRARRESVVTRRHFAHFTRDTPGRQTKSPRPCSRAGYGAVTLSCLLSPRSFSTSTAHSSTTSPRSIAATATRW
jgi:hypothetical protein